MFYTKGRLGLYATPKIGIVVMKLAMIWEKTSLICSKMKDWYFLSCVRICELSDENSYGFIQYVFCNVGTRQNSM